MKKNIIQFHATKEDFFMYIEDILNNIQFVYGIEIIPQFKQYKIDKESLSQCLRKCKFVVVSEKLMPLYDSYEEFSDNTNNKLIISLGEENDNRLVESSIGVISDTDINSEWVKIIKSIKKNMLRGAWCINTCNGAKQYYKNHMYTLNAKKLYDDGVRIFPITGWNIYELTNNEV